MPLSVPLKTSRTGSRIKGNHATPRSHATANSAVQAAAQLAAQSGATAAQQPALSADATAQATNTASSSTAPPPIPPVTGAVWGHGVSGSSIASKQAAAYKPLGLASNTPQAVLRSFHEHEREREAKHWDSKGKQVSSNRVTCPSISFHNGPSGRVVEEKARCREIGEHPCLRNPGPEAYDVKPIEAPCAVPCGWLKEPRFKNSPFEAEKKADNPILQVQTSTNCHPLCPTYPYPEPKPETEYSRCNSAEDPDASKQSDAPSPSKEPPVAPTPAPHPAALEPGSIEERRNPIRTADLNCQYFKYKKDSAWGFGSSGLGFRFAHGTKFSKQPMSKPHQRLRNFRDLRDEIPARSEKEYQEALDKAIAEARVARDAQEAAAAAAAAAAAPAEANVARKSKSATQTNAAEAPSVNETGAAPNADGVQASEQEAPQRESSKTQISAEEAASQAA